MEILMKFAFVCIFLMYQGITMVDAHNVPNTFNAHNVPNTFNVLSFGAKADGVTDDSKAFHEAWYAACNASGGATLLVPSGTYFLNPVRFYGPCRNFYYITFQLEGTLKASEDLDVYGDGGWVHFGWINNLYLTGGGIFDGQGASAWSFNNCHKQKNCKLLPMSIIIVNCNNAIVKNITSLNSKSFHFGVVHSNNLKILNVTTTAPGDSPNTDGIHLERCNNVTIAYANIGTGDDCISIGHGTYGVTINGVSCGPGHGISVGSLGKHSLEESVGNITVQDSFFSGSTNGVRIKTWPNNPISTGAFNMTFKNIWMNNVSNPIIIDQEYCPHSHCDKSVPSSIQISDIHFDNIQGTTSTREAVTIRCSEGVPCNGITLNDIDLKSHTGTTNVTSHCINANVQFTGINNPPPCQ